MATTGDMTPHSACMLLVSRSGKAKTHVGLRVVKTARRFGILSCWAAKLILETRLL